jgi:hypothetical protein
MFGNRRHLVAAILVASVAAACGSGGSASSQTAGPISAPSSQAQVPASTVPTSEVAGTTADSIPTSSGGADLGGTVAKGGDLCGLLGPGDFTAAGIAGTSAPVENFDDAGNYFCVYAGDSGSTGGVEFDAFVGDPAATYKQVTAGAGIVASDATAELPGVDQAGTVLNGAGGMAAIAVREGQFCFDIETPTRSGARGQLLALATLVLQRGSGLTS